MTLPLENPFSEGNPMDPSETLASSRRGFLTTNKGFMSDDLINEAGYSYFS
jgi:hypothetical protein